MLSVPFPSNHCWLITVILLLVTCTSVRGQDLKLEIDLSLPPREQQVPPPQIRNILIDREQLSVERPATEWLVLPEQIEATDKEVAQLVLDLAAPEFRKRKAATDRLKTLPLADLKKLAEELPNVPSAEAVVRVHSELAVRFQSESFDQRKTALELLEQLANQPRLLSADPANHCLKTHWQTRIEVAFQELESLGAIVKDGNFSVPPTPGMRRDDRPARQILLTESWTGGDAGLEIFGRLEALAGPVQSQQGIHVYLLTGHPLTEIQEKRLIDLVGANRIQERSRVALGIAADRGTVGLYDGVLVGSVSKGGSADKAGLESGDLLLAMYNADKDVPLMKYDPDSWRTFRRQIPVPRAPNEGPDQPNPDEGDAPIKISPDVPATEDQLAAHRLFDFDQLVERLKKYRPGDRVKLQVVKKFRGSDRFWAFPNVPRGAIPELEDAQKPKTEKVVEIEVELVGWEQLPMVR